jgi:hypothetical protein
MVESPLAVLLGCDPRVGAEAGGADDSSLSCLATRESSSGSHLGHGHAAVNVVNRRKMTENTRLRDVLMVKPFC